jgi:cation diffusion facilitator family transporter
MASGKSAVMKALIANSGIAVAKFGGWAFTGSATMLAEAIHSVADCANQGLLLLGMKQSEKPVSPDHPLGEHRAIYVWSLVVALLLFFVGGAFSLYEGIHHLQSPEPIKYAIPALIILAVAIALEGWSLKGALDAGKEEREGKTFYQWFRETRETELLVVTGEDIAALGGLVLAFLAVGASYITGNPIYDALGSCAVGILLMIVAVFVYIEVNGLLVGESVEPGLREEIVQYVTDQPEVEKVYNIIAMAHGSMIWIALKVKLENSDKISGDDVADITDLVEERIQQRFPKAKWVFFETDRDRPKKAK